MLTSFPVLAFTLTHIYGYTTTQHAANKCSLNESWYTNTVHTVGNVELDVIRSKDIWLFSTNLGNTFAELHAIERFGNDDSGIFENDGRAKHTWVDSGS